MACTQTLSGIAASCETNVGGIREVYICNFGEVEAYEVDGTTHLVDTLTMASGKKFKAYHFKKNTSSMTSTLNVDPANGVNFVQTDITMVFAKQDTTKRMEIAALSLGEVTVMVLDSNGKYWIVGLDEFAAATSGTAETGVNRTDGNKYTITLTAYEASYPYEVDPTIVSAVIDS